MTADLEPGDRVVTPSGITGTYQGPAVTRPEWRWARIRSDDGSELIYPVWLLTRVDVTEQEVEP